MHSSVNVKQNSMQKAKSLQPKINQWPAKINGFTVIYLLSFITVQFILIQVLLQGVAKSIPLKFFLRFLSSGLAFQYEILQIY